MKRGSPLAFAVSGLMLLLSGCSAFRGPRGFEAVQFEAAPRPAEAEAFPNWPVPPDEAWDTMLHSTAKPEAIKRTQAGTSGAEKAEVFYSGLDESITVKSKRVPDDLDGINNSPRRELAAYSVQQLFLDPPDYVVPPSVIRCIPLAVWREWHGGAGRVEVAGTECVMTNASLWLENVTLPDPLYDKQRFLTDPTYARYMADFNLYAYLADHQDGREGNFLVSKNDAARQVFAIDNGVSFGAIFYNWFVPNWGTLRVAALRRESVDRLRKVTRGDLDALLVVQQLENDGTGRLVTVEPGPPVDPRGGAHAQGSSVQFGLKEREIDKLWERIEKLIERVDSGEIPTF